MLNTGLAIKKALLDKQKTQIWLAEQIGSSQGNLSNLCNKKGASTRTLEPIAEALEMKVSELIALGEK